MDALCKYIPLDKLYKDIVRPKHKQWLMIHTFDFMMIIRWSSHTHDHHKKIGQAEDTQPHILNKR